MTEDSGLGNFLVVVIALALGWLDQRRLKRKKSTAAKTRSQENNNYRQYRIGWRELEGNKQSDFGIRGTLEGGGIT